MEFTYDGLVRYGFGFYNPNHAAAFICALLPFVWLLIFSKSFFNKTVSIVLSSSLLIALAFTYSRAGMLLCSLELLLFALFVARKHWKIFLSLGLIFVIALILSSGLERISIDNSITNRIDIFLSGLALFAQNPFGVGLGNSGEIISATILENINCRTLINSHLTLLAEFGIIIAFIYFFLIIYVLLRNFKDSLNSKTDFVIYISFLGLLISSSISTVFDWQVLFSPQSFEYFSTLNLIMSYSIFIIFLALLIYLLCKNFSLKNFLVSIILTSILFIGLFFIGKSYKQAPKIKNISGDVFIRQDEAPLKNIVLFDNEYNLKEAISILSKHKLLNGSLIALKSWQMKESLPNIKFTKYIVFGECSDFLSDEKFSYIVIKPSQYFKPKACNIEAIYLPKWDRKYYKLKSSLEKQKIKIVDL